MERILNSYLPLDRRRAMSRGEMLPDRLTGAALFADISGFTPLTAILLKSLGSKQGPEELTQHLNKVYDVLITQVYRYMGDIINFSGDGLTCWFNDDSPTNNSLTDSAALRATACGLALQQMMTAFKSLEISRGQVISLRLKVAIAAGPVRRFQVGDPEIQYIDVLAGKTLERMAEAEQLAQAGEVIVGPEVISQIGDAVQVSEWRSLPSTSSGENRRFAVVVNLFPLAYDSFPAQDYPLETNLFTVAENLLSEAQIRPWLLPSVYKRLQKGQEQFLAEIRPAVALFLGFKGIDYDNDEAAGQKLDAYIRFVQNLLAYYEGHLIQVTIGDKGSYLYIAFGAPLAYDDDAERAVAAALTLRSLSTDLRFISQIKIGISRGRMRVGDYGSSMRRTYGVLGNEVNVAAHLMNQAQPGQILITNRMMAAISPGRFEFEALKKMAIKGILNPLQIFSVRERKVRESSYEFEKRFEIVGRSFEKTILSERLQDLSIGRSSTIILTGDAGIGKSHLIKNLFIEAQALNVPTLIGEGQAIEQTAAYHAWRPILRQIFGIEQGMDSTQASQHIIEQLKDEPHLRERLPLFNSMLPLNLPDNELTTQMSGEVRANNIHDMLIQILLEKQKGGSGLLLILEDAHWLDSASWALALALSQRLRPLLLVIVTRTLIRPPTEIYDTLRNGSNTYYLKLEHLAAKEIETLVCQRLDITALSTGVLEIIQQKAEGHPLFSEALAFSLRDQGLIQISNGTGQLAPSTNGLKATKIPDTIEEVIISRVDQLTPIQQLTLKVAAVIGRVFAFPVLHDTHPVRMREPQLYDHLDVTERLGLTRSEISKPELTYTFNHVITQEVVYNLLLASQRRMLHDAIAVWYENHYAHQLDQYYPLLAHHWRYAENVAKTIDYLEQAGEQALKNGAFKEAAGFFEEILELDGGLPLVAHPLSGSQTHGQLRQAGWMCQLGKAYYGLGRLADSRTKFEQALKMLDRKIPITSTKLFIQLLKEVLRQAGHRIWPDKFLDGASETIRDKLLNAAPIYRQLSTIYYLDNKRGLSIYTALRQINVAEQVGPSPELVEAYAVIGLVVGLFRLHGLAETYFQRGLATAQNLPQSFPPVVVWHSSALYRAGVGQFEKGCAEAKQAREIYEKLGDKGSWRDCMTILGTMEYYASDFTQARQTLTRLAESEESDGKFLQQIWAFIWLGGVALKVGRLDDAIMLLERASTFIEKGSNNSAEISCFGFRAVVYWRQGKPQLARQMADEAAALIAQSNAIPGGHFALDGYTGVAEVYLALWETSDDPSEQKILAKAAKQACQALHKYNWLFSIGQPSVWLYEGMYRCLAGKQAKALKAWHKGLTAANRLGMTYEQGRIHYEIGRHFPLSDPRRQQHLDEACQIFNNLKATYDLDLATKARQSTASVDTN